MAGGPNVPTLATQCAPGTPGRPQAQIHRAKCYVEGLLRLRPCKAQEPILRCPWQMPDQTPILSQQIPTGRGSGSPAASPNESNAELGSSRRPLRGGCSAGLAWLWTPGLPAGDSAPAPAGALPALPARPRYRLQRAAWVSG